MIIKYKTNRLIQSLSAFIVFFFLATSSLFALENPEIEKKIDGFEKGLVTKNIDLVMQSFKKDAVWQGVMTYPYVKENATELFNYYKSISLQRIRLELSTLDQRIASSADFRLQATTMQGKPVELKVSFVFLWEKGWDEWQIIAINPLVMVPVDGSVADDLKKIDPGSVSQDTQADRLSPIADSHVYAYPYRNWNKANWGKYDILGAGWHPTGGEKRTYLKFDLSGVDPKNLGKATLKLFHYHTGGNNSLSVGVHAVTGAWQEGSGTYHSGKVEKTAAPGEISWVYQPSFSPYQSANFTPGPGTNNYIEVDITLLVKQWLSGVPNNGLVLKATGNLTRNTPVSVYGFYSREHKDKTKRPVLIFQSAGGTDTRDEPGDEPDEGPGKDNKLDGDSPFGTSNFSEFSLKGNIYYLQTNTSRLPDFGAMSPVGSIYTKELNISNRSFTAGFPGVTNRFEWFGIRYTGTFQIQQGGQYSFRLASDDGSKLWIDNQLIINNDGVHPCRSKSGTIHLNPGQHHIRVDYFQGPRAMVALQLFVTEPGKTEKIFSPEYTSNQTSGGLGGDITWDFETGSTNGWVKTGTAFNHQPTYGDNPTARRRGQPSNHIGNYWIGTYEKYQGYTFQTPGSIQGDGPIGTLTSNVFTIPTGSLSFLVGGGSSFQTRVELFVSGNRVLSVSGRNTETMHRVKWDLNPWAGQQGQIRLVDNASGGWGHINADDFRFSHSSSTGTPGGIRVEFATYGGNCGVAKGNVTPHIARQCNGKSKCRYTVNHKIIGDPAYGCAKTYTVRYRCGNNPQVFEKSLAAEAGWGDKAVLLECADSLNGDGGTDTGWQTSQKGPLISINPKAEQWSSSGGGFMVMNGSHRFDKQWYRRTWGEKDPFYSNGEDTKLPPQHSHAEVMKHAIIKLGKITVRGPGFLALFGRVKGPGAWVKLYDHSNRSRFHPQSSAAQTMYRSKVWAWKNGGWNGSWSGKWSGNVSDLYGNKPMGGWVPPNKIVTYDIELDQGWYNNMNVPFGSMGFGAPQEIDYELWFFPREGGGVKLEKYPGSASTTGSLPPSQEIKKVITGYGKKK